MRGIFKCETGENFHFIAVTSKSDSGLQIGVWIKRALSLKERSRDGSNSIILQYYCKVLQYFGIATSQSIVISIAKSQSIAILIANFSSIAKSIAKFPSIAKSIVKIFKYYKRYCNFFQVLQKILHNSNVLQKVLQNFV